VAAGLRTGWTGARDSAPFHGRLGGRPLLDGRHEARPLLDGRLGGRPLLGQQARYWRGPTSGARRALPSLCVTAVLAPLLALSAAAAEPEESLARYVPADVGLFIEGRQVADLLLPLAEPQAWLTLAELAGQPAAIEETSAWRLRIQQTVQMDPAEALSVLFSRQFAFVAEGPRRAQDAVILCRPTAATKALLERWQAQPLPTAGRTSVYRLPARLGLALPAGLLMFGDDVPADGMFWYVLDFVDRGHGPALADDPVYRRLLARVPEKPDAVLFARFGSRSRPAPPTSRATVAPATPPTSAPASASTSSPATAQAAQPASVPASMPPTATGPSRSLPELPGPLRGASNILLALHRGDGLLHFSAVGDAAARQSNGDTGLKALIERLPERTLFACGLHLDYPGLLRALEALPERSVLRVAFKLRESSAVQKLVEALGSATCLAVGTVEPASRTVAAPPVPAAAVLVAARQPQVVAAEADALSQATVSLCNLLALTVGSQRPLPAIAKVPLGDVEASVLDLSDLLREQPGGAAVAELHVCWALDGDVLIIASHLDWLRQILAARRGQGPTLAALLSLSRRAVTASSETILAVQSGAIADLGNRWLSYIEQHAPQALQEDWWRKRQPGGDNIRLGIQVTEVPERKRLRVTSVAAHAPADGVLRPGDEITGCNGRPFATSQPVGDMRTGMLERPNARWIDVSFERSGAALFRRVPLPFADPVQTLRRVIAVGQIAQRVLYHDDAPDEGGARGFLTVELRPPQPVPSSAPTTGPTSAPATAPAARP
jgi:hypothetical protein